MIFELILVPDLQTANDKLRRLHFLTFCKRSCGTSNNSANGKYFMEHYFLHSEEQQQQQHSYLTL